MFWSGSIPRLSRSGRSIVLIVGPKTDPILLRMTTMTECEVLQRDHVIATAESWNAAQDIAEAMTRRYPNIPFTWRWKE
jgi:hypothetical protein